MLSPAFSVTIAFLDKEVKPFFPRRIRSRFDLGFCVRVLTLFTVTPKVSSMALFTFVLVASEQTEKTYWLRLAESIVAFSVRRASFRILTDSFIIIEENYNLLIKELIPLTLQIT